MINPTSQNLGAAVEIARLRESGRAKSAAPLGSAITSPPSTESASPAARLAAEGAPVDIDRVAAIKAAIASGNYPVNAAAIAERMVALDLPVA